jgi:ribosomal protein RSM22 (predicted rRNA methylase)
MTLDRMRRVNDVALAVDRPHWTIRRWARLGRIPSERRDGHVFVDLVAAAELSEQTPRRNRANAAA